MNISVTFYILSYSYIVLSNIILSRDIIIHSMLLILQHSVNIIVFAYEKLRVRCKYVLFFQCLRYFLNFYTLNSLHSNLWYFLCNSASNYSTCRSCGKSNAAITNLIAREYLKGSIENFLTLHTFWLVENYAISPQLATVDPYRLRGKVDYDIVH